MNLFNKNHKNPFIFFPKTSKYTKITKIFYLNKNHKNPFFSLEALSEPFV